MSDLISRQAAIETAVRAAIDWHRLANPQYSIAYCIGEAMRKLPSAAREGHWIKHGEPPWYVIECSECGAKWQMSGSWDANNFCGNCGADMRGEKDD